MATPGQTAVQGMNEQQILAINYLIDLKMARLSEGQVEHTLETLRMGEAELTRRLGEMDVKFGQMDAKFIEMQDLHNRAEAARRTQEEYIRGEFVKAHGVRRQLGDDGHQAE